MGRNIAAGLALIKSFESCTLTSYQDETGLWTIGWGRARGIGPNQSCTQEQADQALLQDVDSTCHGLDWFIPPTRLNDNQFSALVSFTYNVGLGNFEKSTLLKLILAEQLSDAADELLVWKFAGGKESPGLLRRRIAERALFLTSL